MSSNLFKPLKLGNITLQNRVVLAPLTRRRADKDHVPLPFVAEYYAQRGCVAGTLLITEATFISPRAGGSERLPGIYDQAQIEAWKEVTKAVHGNGSFIFMQLWALGREAEPDVLKRETGRDVESSSDIASEDGVRPIPMTEDDIWDYVKTYAQAAKNAIEAGFDGVEIHGANGYLIDQFTQDTTNNRTDAWGGSIENRARFAIEVTKAVVDAIGAERTGIRISPWSPFNGMRMKDLKPQFSYLTHELKNFKLAYLHVVESRVYEPEDDTENVEHHTSEKLDFLVDIWDNVSPFLIAGGFNAESARATVDVNFKNRDVAIVFGRYFISNPDLVFRLEKGIELTPYDRKTFYVKESQEGYTTWPFSKDFEGIRV